MASEERGAAISGAGGFAERLRQLLKRSGQSQADLARHADIDQSSISRYLRGECEPNLRQLRAIAKALRCPPTLLIAEATSEIHAVHNKTRGCWMLFQRDTLVGEWHPRAVAPVLHIATVDADLGRKLLEQHGRRGNGKRR